MAAAPEGVGGLVELGEVEVGAEMKAAQASRKSLGGGDQGEEVSAGLVQKLKSPATKKIVVELRKFNNSRRSWS